MFETQKHRTVLCVFCFHVFLFPGGLKPSRVFFSLGNWLILPESTGKSTLHGERREPSSVFDA